MFMLWNVDRSVGVNIISLGGMEKRQRHELGMERTEECLNVICPEL